jgi:hypothetical protein
MEGCESLSVRSDSAGEVVEARTEISRTGAKPEAGS